MDILHNNIIFLSVQRFTMNNIYHMSTQPTCIEWYVPRNLSDVGDWRLFTSVQITHIFLHLGHSPKWIKYGNMVVQSFISRVKHIYCIIGEHSNCIGDLLVYTAHNMVELAIFGARFVVKWYSIIICSILILNIIKYTNTNL